MPTNTYTKTCNWKFYVFRNFSNTEFQWVLSQFVKILKWNIFSLVCRNCWLTSGSMEIYKSNFCKYHCIMWMINDIVINYAQPHLDSWIFGSYLFLDTIGIKPRTKINWTSDFWIFTSLRVKQIFFKNNVYIKTHCSYGHFIINKNIYFLKWCDVVMYI